MGDFGLTYDIGDADRARFAPDAVWSAQALPNATDMSSSVIQFGRTEAALEFIMEADEDTTVADGNTLTLTVYHDTSEDGPFTASKVVGSYAPSGSDQTFDEGDKIFRYVADQDIETYCYFVVTASADQSGTDVTAWLDRISR